MSVAPRVKLRSVQLFERPVTLRLPFRFGAATVTEAPQAFVRVQAEVNGQLSVGATAELMVPKWFDKSPQLTHAQNFEQLRHALRLAREAALDAGLQPSAHALSLATHESSLRAALAHGLPRLAAQFGPAQIDKAVADAVLRALDLGWCDGVQQGVLGDPWSRSLTIQKTDQVTLRHTVGLADRLRDDEPGPDPADGLPATLTAAIAACGLTHFKLKLSGDTARDLQRLIDIAAVLDTQAGDYRVTLDGNESFADVQSLGDTWQALQAEPRLRRLLANTLLLEQPLPRYLSLQQPIRELGIPVPVIIDESDDHDEAFEEALALGYRGISSKACKGLYRSLRNAAWTAQHAGSGLVLSGEDLTCQAGLAVQQDTLLAASLGIGHIERNGHHYVQGFGCAPDSEAQAFLSAHDGFYVGDGGRPRLKISQGQLDLRTLHGPGFASAVHPLWSSLQPIT